MPWLICLHIDIGIEYPSRRGPDDLRGYEWKFIWPSRIISAKMWINHGAWRVVLSFVLTPPIHSYWIFLNVQKTHKNSVQCHKLFEHIIAIYFTMTIVPIRTGTRTHHSSLWLQEKPRSAFQTIPTGYIQYGSKYKVRWCTVCIGSTISLLTINPEFGHKTRSLTTKANPYGRARLKLKL